MRVCDELQQCVFVKPGGKMHARAVREIERKRVLHFECRIRKV